MIIQSIAGWNFRCYSTFVRPIHDKEGESNGASFFQSLMACGTLWNTERRVTLPLAADGVPLEIHATDLGNLGIDSIISSVSESTDGSYDSSDESDGSSDECEGVEDIEGEIEKLHIATAAFRRFV